MRADGQFGVERRGNLVEPDHGLSQRGLPLVPLVELGLRRPATPSAKRTSDCSDEASAAARSSAFQARDGEDFRLKPATQASASSPVAAWHRSRTPPSRSPRRRRPPDGGQPHHLGAQLARPGRREVELAELVERCERHQNRRLARRPRSMAWGILDYVNRRVPPPSRQALCEWRRRRGTAPPRPAFATDAAAAPMAFRDGPSAQAS